MARNLLPLPFGKELPLNKLIQHWSISPIEIINLKVYGNLTGIAVISLKPKYADHTSR